MKVLISPASIEEAKLVLETNAEIVDVKNPDEGSLGANFPWNIKEVVDLAKQRDVVISATLGDLPFKPGTSSLAAFGLAFCGVDYIKAGLYGMSSYKQAFEMMSSIRRAVKMVNGNALVVASGYADYKKFDGLSLRNLVQASFDAKCDVVMIDTAIKDGSTLFDNLTIAEIQEFVQLGHEKGMKVALAGSIKMDHISLIAEFNEGAIPDIIGVRGVVCEGNDRKNGISKRKVEEFLLYVQKTFSLKPYDSVLKTVSNEF